MQSVFFGHSGSTTPSLPASQKARSQESTSPSSVSLADEVRFGSHSGEPDDLPPQGEPTPAPTSERSDKLKLALGAAKTAAFNKKDLKKDLLWSAIITVLTCWAPGSQLITIPLFIAAAMSFRAILAGYSAYRHPDRQNQPAPQND